MEVFYFNGIQIITRFSSQEVPHSRKLRTSLQSCPNDVRAAYEQLNFFSSALVYVHSSV